MVYTTINVKPKTKDLLNKIGRIDESYDDLVLRLVHDAASYLISKNHLEDLTIEMIENRS